MLSETPLLSVFLMWSSLKQVPTAWAVIKLLKKECGMGMADAKAAMDSAPTVIKKGLEKYAAQSLVSQFADVGAKIKVQ